MLGTIVNTCTIILGSTFGALVRSGIGEKYKKTLFDGLGLCCLVLGMNASLPNMAKSEFPVLFILSLAIGGLIGTKLNLAGRIERQTTSSSKNPSAGKEVSSGLVTGCLLYCIGTFSIVGPVLSALSPTAGWSWGESANTFLYTNATLDFVSSAVLAASYGWIMLLANHVLPHRILLCRRYARAYARGTQHRRWRTHHQLRTQHPRHQRLQDSQSPAKPPRAHSVLSAEDVPQLLRWVL